MLCFKINLRNSQFVRNHIIKNITRALLNSQPEPVVLLLNTLNPRKCTKHQPHRRRLMDFVLLLALISNHTPIIYRYSNRKVRQTDSTTQSHNNKRYYALQRLQLANKPSIHKHKLTQISILYRLYMHITCQGYIFTFYISWLQLCKLHSFQTTYKISVTSRNLSTVLSITLKQVNKA